MTITKNAAPAAPVNLTETRAAQTAAKAAHPAGKQAPAKALAEKAPTKQPAKKAVPIPAGSKLRWQRDGEKDSKGRAPQTATADNGAVYKITGADAAWKAVVTIDGKTEVLAEAGHTACYTACVRHHRGAKTAAA